MITLTNDHDLGPMLRRLRRDAGLTQTELGESIHISKGGVSKREVESCALPVFALVDHARALGYDLALVPREDT